MITEYAVPSWAPNHHCKKYQFIYESVFSYLSTCMRNKYSCMKCPHTSNVEGDQYFNSQQAWACWDMVARGIVFKFPDWQSNVHFPWPNELTICADINCFQIPLKTSRTGHRWCKEKDFVLCSGKICLVCFHGSLFFCFICHLCLLHKINAQTPITAILSTYLIHEFLVNVKCSVDGSHRKPYICLSFDFLIQYSANGTCLTSVSIREYVTPLCLLWKSY